MWILMKIRMNPHRFESNGTRKAKLALQKGKKCRNFMLELLDVLFCGAVGFSCSLDALHGGNNQYSGFGSV
jgi:hypothetical protein